MKKAISFIVGILLVIILPACSNGENPNGGNQVKQNPEATITMEDGKTYPVIKVEVSSASHPFYTGKNVFIDTAGRVEKFRNRYQKKA